MSEPRTLFFRGPTDFDDETWIQKLQLMANVRVVRLIRDGYKNAPHSYLRVHVIGRYTSRQVREHVAKKGFEPA